MQTVLDSMPKTFSICSYDAIVSMFSCFCFSIYMHVDIKYTAKYSGKVSHEFRIFQYFLDSSQACDHEGLKGYKDKCYFDIIGSRVL